MKMYFIIKQNLSRRLLLYSFLEQKGRDTRITDDRTVSYTLPGDPD